MPTKASRDVQDRLILEGDPHSIVEAMAIAGYAIGANEGYIYIRGEYALAKDRLSRAIAQARQMKVLGQNIFGSGFDFDIHIHAGAGAYICGEETALIESIEGKRGEPRSRPPTRRRTGCGTSRQRSTTWRPWLTCRPLFATAQPGTGVSAPATARAPRFTLF